MMQSMFADNISNLGTIVETLVPVEGKKLSEHLIKEI
jgi:hypothetical protein